MLSSVVYGLLGFAKEADQLGRKDIGNTAEDASHNTAAYNTKAYTLFYSIIFVRAQILTNEGGSGLAETGDGQEGKTLDLGVTSAAGHGGGAEAVDVGLNNQIGKGNDGILNTGGKAQPDDGL